MGDAAVAIPVDVRAEPVTAAAVDALGEQPQSFDGAYHGHAVHRVNDQQAGVRQCGEDAVPGHRQVVA
jgi:hypothetical protein